MTEKKPAPSTEIPDCPGLLQRPLSRRVDWEFQFSHPVEKVWPYLSDTERMNRAFGLPPAKYRHEPDSRGGSRRYGELKHLGQTWQWLEHPYEWVEPRYFRVSRSYTAGPLREMDVLWVLEPAGAGSRVRQFISFTAAGILGWAVERQFRSSVRRNALRAYEHLEKFLFEKSERAFLPSDSEPLPIHPPVDELTLRARLSRSQVSETEGRLLTELIATAPSVDLVRLRPFVLARQLARPRDEVLTAMLRATRGGVLSLSWDVLCPGCRGAKSRNTQLGDLPDSVHCEACNIDFKAEGEDSLELSFTVSPAVRPIVVAEFCVGGPQNTPQTFAQLRLPAGVRARFSVELPAGIYRLRSPHSSQSLKIEVSPEAPAEVFRHRFDAAAKGIEDRTARAGKIAFELENPGDAEVGIFLEATRWLEDACTVKRIANFQDFRDLFAKEVLRPGQSLEIGSVALMFTDLKGSTALYRRVGDARAFAMVQDHFEILISAVRGAQGALVKTIGDAVMAAFNRPADALKAALEIHRQIAEANSSGKFPEPLVVKIGLHYGPCYVVNSNDRLDYFGSTVNIAARTEGQCLGGDIVATATVLEDPVSQSHLGLAEKFPEKFETSLKGFDERFELYRISCAAPDAALTSSGPGPALRA